MGLGLLELAQQAESVSDSASLAGILVGITAVVRFCMGGPDSVAEGAAAATAGVVSTGADGFAAAVSPTPDRLQTVLWNTFTGGMAGSAKRLMRLNPAEEFVLDQAVESAAEPLRDDHTNDDGTP
jgi:hypothetical protein